MINKMIFENYKDYLLSLNIAQISREFGYKKIGMSSFYLLTNIIRKFIEKISIDTQKQVENSGRTECNIIDLLYTLASDRKINQQNILYYINSSKIKYDFTKANYLNRLILTEEKERNNLIKKINMNSIKVTDDDEISAINIKKNIINAIPPMLRYFPTEYGNGTGTDGDENLNKLNILNNLLDDTKNKNKQNNMLNNANERKTIEELNNTINYFDMSKKHIFHRNKIDLNNIFNNIGIVKENFILGQKHSRYLLEDNKKEINEENEGDGDNKEDDLYEGLRAKKGKYS